MVLVYMYFKHPLYTVLLYFTSFSSRWKRLCSRYSIYKEFFDNLLVNLDFIIIVLYNLMPYREIQVAFSGTVLKLSRAIDTHWFSCMNFNKVLRAIFTSLSRKGFKIMHKRQAY